MFRRSTYGRHWSAADDRRLQDLADSGRSDHEIALTIGRSRESVAERRDYLRLVGTA